ncbi:unnamed protein product [Heligmosomoides polygyrus]|uniref:Transposase n=1 Tax=Heligmosomoides polygyrus TaxID=6339 RepID=A0A183FF16_HELPZ|nr:unnamed protein product [Heligmosomoides polygyrus]
MLHGYRDWRPVQGIQTVPKFRRSLTNKVQALPYSPGTSLLRAEHVEEVRPSQTKERPQKWFNSHQVYRRLQHLTGTV